MSFLGKNAMAKDPPVMDQFQKSAKKRFRASKKSIFKSDPQVKNKMKFHFFFHTTACSGSSSFSCYDFPCPIQHAFKEKQAFRRGKNR
jgi:hypothetical protein